MAELSFRDTILLNLREKHIRQQQIEKYISSYNELSSAYSLLSLKYATKQNLNPQNGEGISIEQSAAERQLKALTDILSKLQGSNNLLEEKVKEHETTIDELTKSNEALTKENNTFKIVIESNDIMLRNQEEDLLNERAAMKLLSDDYIEVSLRATMLNEELSRSRAEYFAIVEQFTNLKLKEADRMNAEVDIEFERQNLKKIANIHEAISNSPKIDLLNSSVHSACSFEMIAEDERNQIPMGSLGGFDVLMSECVSKTTCGDAFEILDLRWDHTGDALYIASGNKAVFKQLFKSERLFPCASFNKAKKAVNRIDLCEDKGLLLGASNDFCIYVWNTSNQTCRSTFTGHQQDVFSAKFFDDNKKLISGGRDKLVKVWDLNQQQIIRNFTPGTTCNDLIDFPDMNSCFLSGHQNKKLYLWDDRTSDSQAVSSYEFEDKIRSLSAVPCSGEIVCEIADDTLTRIDPRYMTEKRSYSAEQYKSLHTLTKCCISPNGNYLATGSSNGNIFIWNLDSSKMEKVLSCGKNGHDKPVISVAWHPNGNYLASGDAKGNICIWR
uniref:WD_REPEATS_REGION domain-containing protein n=1 Tax=Rhabditophanes sp. KR3021 TaxID=114890 RepID=A0AC35TMH1_9BILA